MPTGEVTWSAIGHWCPDRRPGTNQYYIFIVTEMLSVIMAPILNIVRIVIN